MVISGEIYGVRNACWLRAKGTRLRLRGEVSRGVWGEINGTIAFLPPKCRSCELAVSSWSRFGLNVRGVRRDRDVQFLHTPKEMGRESFSEFR